VTPDTRNDPNSASEQPTSEPAAPEQPRPSTAQAADEGAVVLPDSYRAHHGPTPLAPPTQQKTHEAQTVKIQDDAVEDRRRDTVRLRKKDLPSGRPALELEDAVSPQDEITAPDHHALDVQLALRRVTATSRSWTLLGGAAGVVAIVGLVLVVRSMTSGPARAPAAEPASAAAISTTGATAALLPPPPTSDPAPQPTAEPDPEPTLAALAPEPEAPSTRPTAAASPKIRRKPASESGKSPPASTAPPKAAFPPPPASKPPSDDIRREVPF
jgi:hypothetical protein